MRKKQKNKRIHTIKEYTNHKYQYIHTKKTLLASGDPSEEKIK